MLRYTQVQRETREEKKELIVVTVPHITALPSPMAKTPFCFRDTQPLGPCHSLEQPVGQHHPHRLHLPGLGG